MLVGCLVVQDPRQAFEVLFTIRLLAARLGPGEQTLPSYRPSSGQKRVCER
jgi:hypothetical protein